MARFFIDRPIFAWVIAIFITLAGVLSMFNLPVAQYPNVAPPQVTLSVTYPGATAQTVEDSVIQIIEQEMNGATGLYYFESESASGSGKITLSFTPETDVELASVDVLNRLKRVESRLPNAVNQQGININKSRRNYMAIVQLTSTDGSMDAVDLGDLTYRNVLYEIKRLPGVGDAMVFGSEKAMRIWLDPVKLTGFRITADNVASAIRSQNIVVTPGAIANPPNTGKETFTANVNVHGQLQTPEEFENIILRANPDGSTVRIKDVGRVELGSQAYDKFARLDGKPVSGFGVLPSATANTMETMRLIREKMEELKQYFPRGVDYVIANDTSQFVSASIHEVIKTLFEGVILVFLIMFLFLQNFRYTIIPTIVVPIALMGTLAVMKALGFSINMLTMFGMVLSIGILIDDAIVVVENVERIMAEEGLPPKEATRKAMDQITGAIVGISTVLTAVFIPMAFFSGSVGNIYRQFSVTMVASMVFSAFLALSLTPALCATILKPVDPKAHGEKKGFFGWFNRKFNIVTTAYSTQVGKVLGRIKRYCIIYGAIVICMGFMFWRLPTSFLPNEDQGYLYANVQLPAGATQQRTIEVLKQVEDQFMHEPGVLNTVGVFGISFSGSGQNGGLAFVTLKDFSERSSDDSATAIVGRAFARFSQIRDALVFPLSPPPIRELGTETGFDFRLQDRSSQGNEKLVAARDQLMKLANESPVIKTIRFDGMENAPQLKLEIDREKANALGVSFSDINASLSTAFGSAYVNDFDSKGRQQRVIVQLDADKRVDQEDFGRLFVKSASGTMVPLSSFCTTRWEKGPIQLIRYNGYPAMRLVGTPADGYSSGDAMNEMVNLMKQLPEGFGYEWTGTSLEEQKSGSQAPLLYALSIMAVFLCLAALYESTTIPVAVLLVVPLGVIGALIGVYLRGMPNDIYFKVGLIATIGLSAKNAILIVEFAKDLEEKGMGVFEATMEAVRLRFRPILMTSFAFILGVVPLAIAHGAGAASQQAIGTGVMFGMISATVLAVYMVPVFYVVVRTVFNKKKLQTTETTPPETEGDTEKAETELSPEEGKKSWKEILNALKRRRKKDNDA
ncbi:MAG: efflux RND transporter permease subunit [Oxalobacter sp.]|jgi:multidrug efflux pump|nr:efflux RND transporter permease subunit [Oxalobacter sp.]MBR6000437.1 efflux RND transporter permease subunit [Oxalobacter sp.]